MAGPVPDSSYPIFVAANADIEFGAGRDASAITLGQSVRHKRPMRPRSLPRYREQLSLRRKALAEFRHESGLCLAAFDWPGCESSALEGVARRNTSGKIVSTLPPAQLSFALAPSGTIAAHSGNLLTSERMATRSADLRKAFDFVIVDAPPLAHYPDATALGKLSDGIVLVIEAGSTSAGRRPKPSTILRASGIAILAVVLNKQR